MSSTSYSNTGNSIILNGRSIVVSNMIAPTSQITNLSVDLINGLPPPSAPPIVAPLGSILTVTSPGVATFYQNADLNNIDVVNLDISGNLRTNSISGTTNQYIKKTSGTTQLWSNILASDISPGAASTVMTTNSLGTATQFSTSISVNGDLIFNGDAGTAGKFVKKSSGTQIWDNIDASDITPGTNGQVVVTSGGVSGWGTAPPSVITPGPIYSIATTDGSSNVGWSSTIRPTNILFNATSQTNLSYYEEFSFINTMTMEDNSNLNNFMTFTRIGNKVSVKIESNTVSIGVSFDNYYRSFPIPLRFKPSYGVNVDYSDYHCELLRCTQGTNITTGAAYIGFGTGGGDGICYLFTNIQQSLSLGEDLTNYAHTFNYLMN